MNETARAVAANARRGDWIITFTGRRFWPLDPRAADVSFRDVAHALAHICRYGGHATRFYSVAEHSVLLARYFRRRGDWTWARWAAVHDAPEAYIGDMVRPLKHEAVMAPFRAAEQGIERAVFERAGLAGDIPAEVHAADKAIILDEMRALFPRHLKTLGIDRRSAGLGLGLVPVGLRPHIAERQFLDTFAELFPEVAV